MDGNKLVLSGTMTPALPGEYPHVVMGPQNMMQDMTDTIRRALQGKYDPDRGDQFNITITIELEEGEYGDQDMEGKRILQEGDDSDEDGPRSGSWTALRRGLSQYRD